MTYEYKIGTSQAGLVTLFDLDIPAPKHDFVPSSVRTGLGDGSISEDGWPTDEWYWGFITSAQRQILRDYIPGAGAHIFIRDLLDDGLTWSDFEVEVEWPVHQDRQSLRFLGFALKFTAMIALDDIDDE